MVIRSFSVRRALAALAVPALLLSTGACGLEKTEKKDDTPAASSTPTGGASPDASSGADGDGTCTYEENGASAGKDVDLPPTKPDLADSVTATLDTSIGDIVLTLDPERAPCTVNSFVSLAEQGYYDDTTCHRVIPGFMAQCGDPSASGSGGPGYSYDDELHGDEQYPPGALAMANAGPATNGSQFFVVTGEATHLSTHTVFGQADEDSLQRLLKAEKDGTAIDIAKVTIS